MNKAELIEEIASKAKLSKTDAKAALEAFLGVVKSSLKSGDSVIITGFGTYSVSERSARTGVNPLTKKAIKIPKKNVVKFKAGKDLKEAVA